MEKAVFRIIDANYNRAREALRAIEEFCRFGLNSEQLSGKIKNLRHQLSQNISLLDSAKLIASRDTENDVGKDSKRASEMKRTDATDIFMANIQRVKESLRVLEEFSKIVDRRLAIRFRRIRFKTYDIEKRTIKRLHDTA
jgi:thiamine-phosphate pyrophosphorylase